MWNVKITNCASLVPETKPFSTQKATAQVVEVFIGQPNCRPHCPTNAQNIITSTLQHNPVSYTWLPDMSLHIFFLLCQFCQFRTVCSLFILSVLVDLVTGLKKTPSPNKVLTGYKQTLRSTRNVSQIMIKYSKILEIH